MSGSDDQSVLVWDKQTTQLLEELKGHDGPVSFTLKYFWLFYNKQCRQISEKYKDWIVET